MSLVFRPRLLHPRVVRRNIDGLWTALEPPEGMMKAPDPFSSKRFPETRYSVVRAIQSGDPATRERALDQVIESYWKAVYKYLRVRWGEGHDEARDLTQAFFTAALERNLFDRYDAERSRFRTFLRICLDGFASNERKARTRVKRGGTARIESLDFESAEGELRSLEIPTELDTEQFFLREWIRGFFELAVTDLRAQLLAEKKEVYFQLFDRYDLSQGAEPPPTYQGLADELGIPVTQVTNHLASARRRFREIVLGRLRGLTTSEQEFREEARALLGIDPGPGAF